MNTRLLRMALSLSSALSVATPMALAQTSPCERIPHLLPTTEKLRDLKAINPIRCVALQKEEFARAQAEHYQALAPKNQLRHEEKLYRLIGLLPAEYHYESCFLKESALFIGAFYDVIKKTVVLPAFETTADDVVVHELVHALQDQHFDLLSETRRNAHSNDASLAFSAVVEGDARVVQERFRKDQVDTRSEQQPIEDPSEGDSAPNECSLPETIEALSLFPYTFGRFFIDRIYRESGITGVNRYLTTPPSSTATIIHRLPTSKVNVSIDKKAIARVLKLLGASKFMRLVHSDTIGQFTIRTLLGTALSRQDAVIGAVGWRGDSARVFSNDASDVLVWRSLWKDPAEAQQFALGLARVLGLRFAPQSTPQLSRALLSDPSQSLLLEVSDNEVLVGRRVAVPKTKVPG